MLGAVQYVRRCMPTQGNVTEHQDAFRLHYPVHCNASGSICLVITSEQEVNPQVRSGHRRAGPRTAIYALALAVTVLAGEIAAPALEEMLSRRCHYGRMGGFLGRLPVMSTPA